MKKAAKVEKKSVVKKTLLKSRFDNSKKEDLLSNSIKKLEQIKKEIVSNEFLPKDYDEKGTVFVSPKFGYLATGYFNKQRTQIIEPPYYLNSIFFQLGKSVLYKKGCEENMVHFSYYVSNSKKLTAWLKKHPSFNKDFYINKKLCKSIPLDKYIVFDFEKLEKEKQERKNVIEKQEQEELVEKYNISVFSVNEVIGIISQFVNENFNDKEVLNLMFKKIEDKFIDLYKLKNNNV